MNNGFENIFTKDGIFLASSAAGVLLLLLNAVLSFTGGAYTQAALLFAMAVSLICLFAAFRQHDKKTMYGLIGMLLGFLIMGDVFRLIADSSSENPAAMAKYLLLICLDLLFCLNHFLINSGHSASPSRVSLNQTLVIVLLLAVLIIGIVNICRGTGAKEVTEAFSGMGGYMCAIICIACIESKIDAYKLVRSGEESSGNWNESSKEELKKHFLGK